MTQRAERASAQTARLPRLRRVTSPSHPMLVRAKGIMETPTGTSGHFTPRGGLLAWIDSVELGQSCRLWRATSHVAQLWHRRILRERSCAKSSHRDSVIRPDNRRALGPRIKPEAGMGPAIWDILGSRGRVHNGAIRQCVY